MGTAHAFVANMQEIRRRAREHLDMGARTAGFPGDVATAVALLNDAVATEIVCALRYTFHSLTAQGVNSEGVRKEFAAHAAEEQEHMEWLAERICQLGGKPILDPALLTARSATEYIEAEDLLGMIRENLVAERIGIETYRDLIKHFGTDDPTTRTLLERILAKEEEHASDMLDLLSAHGR